MINGTSSLDPARSDEFFWYATGDTVEIKVGTGPWVAATPHLDPNGVAGFQILFAGPSAPATPGATVLDYGVNPIQVRVDGGAVASGGTVYVGEYGLWLDPYSPDVAAAVVLGTATPGYTLPDPPDPSVSLALKIASDILGPLSAFAVHPAGIAVEEYRARPGAHRITAAVQPIQRVISLTHVDPVSGLDVEMDLSAYRLTGQSLYFNEYGTTCWDSLMLYSTNSYNTWDGLYSRPLPFTNGQVRTDTLTLTYAFGSTINAGARHALLQLAHQFWLASTGGDCELPERVLNVNREGLSYTLIDPQTFLDQGRTGLPAVDMWLRSINPAKAKTRSSVHTPDSPPGVNLSYRTRTV